MNKLNVFILALFFSITGYAATNTGHLIQQYLKTVYPTSKKILQMKQKEAVNFYEKHLHFWYRIPSKNIPKGLLTNTIATFSGTFMQPDTVAIDGNAGNSISIHGFTSNKTIDGSNKNHIEVVSYGMSAFPYGAYFYWAPGSGIYLNTEGSTLQAYNKIGMLFELLNISRHRFVEMLSHIPMVHRQVWGTVMYQLRCNQPTRFIPRYMMA